MASQQTITKLQWIVRLIAQLALAGLALAQQYSLVENCQGGSFLSCFNFFTGNDPTNGFVDYVDPDNATKTNLVQVGTNSVIVRADSTHNVALSSRGRPSVRLEGKHTYTHGLFVFSLSHMPFGCGTWPAIWTLGPDWRMLRAVLLSSHCCTRIDHDELTDAYVANGGEIDIIEGVNDQAHNWATLHTGSTCTTAGMNETGTLQTNDCNSHASTSGCIVQDTSSASYGSSFNKNGGGVYAMQWTSDFIRVWFFAHSATPVSVKNGAPDPAKDFGKPMANFQGSCDIDQRFRQHHAIIDLTFCGDWAGNVFGSSGCAMSKKGDAMGSCKDYVAKTPGVFKDAYWDINYLKVFQTPKASQSPSSSKMSTTVTQSVSPIASKSVSSASVGMGKSSSTGTSRLVSVTSSVRPSSISMSIKPTSSSKSSSVKPVSSSNSKPTSSTKVTSSSKLTSSTHKLTGNPNRLIPTPSLPPPRCNELFAPPPLPPRRTGSSSSIDDTASTMSTAARATPQPFDMTSTLQPLPTGNPDAMNAIIFHIFCDSVVNGLPIVRVIHLKNADGSEAAIESRWGPDEALVQCLSRCSDVSPQECAGVGFYNGSDTGDHGAACRFHGIPDTHNTFRQGNNTTAPSLNTTVADSMNATLHRRLSKRLGVPAKREEPINPADLLSTRYHAGNFAAIRAPASAMVSGGGGQGGGKTVPTSVASMTENVAPVGFQTSSAVVVSTGMAGGGGSTVLPTVQERETVKSFVTVTAAPREGCSASS